MKKVRHQVKRIHPEAPAAFDNQFWPVLMAICVVAAIAAGAIVSLLHGTAMWLSLLLLPVVALTAIIILYRLDDSFLRRSLQLAILLSLGVHLLILMISSLLTIFSSAAPTQTAKLIRKPQRSIVVTNQAQKLIVHQLHKQKTPDNPVETQKTQTNPQTQQRDVPIVRQDNPQQRQISQRRMDQPVVPRKEQQLAERKRSNTQNRPVSSAGQVSVRSIAKPAAAAAASKPKPAKTDIAKQSKTDSSYAKANANAPSTPSASAKLASSSAQRRIAKNSAAKESKATAHRRRESVSIPKVANRATVSPTKRVAEKSPVAKSSKLAVQRQSIAPTNPTKAKSVVKNSQPRKLEQTSARRVSSQTRNSIKSEQISRTVDRAVAAKTPTAKANLQPVKRSVASDSASRSQPQPQSFAVTRAAKGAVGAGRSSNLDRITGGDASPVSIASDSSHRQQSNRSSDNISLSALQKSSRMDSGSSSQSQRVLKADTVRWAQRSGGSRSAAKSVQASAASVDSSLSRQRETVAMEKGTSMLDVGATKVVTETSARRRSGGGSPELSDSLVRQSRPTGGRTTNNEIKSDAVVEIEASQMAAAESSQLSTGDGQIADFESRTASDVAPRTVSRGQVSFEDEGSRESGRPVAMSKHRGGTDSNSTSVASDELAAATNERAGNSRSRIAQAPSVNQQIKVGGDNPSSDSIGQVAVDDGNTGIADSVERSDGGSENQQTGNAKVATAEPGQGDSRGAGLSNLKRRSQGNESDANSNDEIGLANDSSPRRANTGPSTNSSVVMASSSDSATESSDVQGLEISEADSTEISRQASQSNVAEAGMKLEIDADEGAAGLAGVASRRAGTMLDASVESDQLSPQRESRFTRKQSGGSPSVVPNVTIGKEAFRQRNPAALANSGPSTEAAIELGLAFLARNQLADGSWTLGQFDSNDPLYQNQLSSDTAATGLALLAFQGAGYNHREYKYAPQIKAAVDWLVRNQASDGCLYVESDKKSNSSCRLYSHGIAALAMTEAYGMTQDETIRDATQRALDYIANTQDRNKGGWRYYATRNMRSSDTSVTGWMMMALKSARLAGLNTRKSTIDGITGWLRVAQSPDAPHKFRYNPYAVDSPGVSRAHGKEVSTTMTSVGLLMQVYSGWKPNDAQFINGADVLLTQLPSDENSRMRDTYYWYYATQVLKHAGGDRWERWKNALHPLLINSQVKNSDLAGSWHPYKPVPDRWGPQGGRLYVTAMNLLSLEVKYRLLPLYEKTID